MNEQKKPQLSKHPTKKALQKQTLRGCLQQYANPALITSEKSAWQDAVTEKHKT